MSTMHDEEVWRAGISKDRRRNPQGCKHVIPARNQGASTIAMLIVGVVLVLALLFR